MFFVDASSSNTIVAYLQNIALTKSAGKSEQDALTWLSREHKEWLLLFDGADDVMLNLRDYFPRCSHGNILITSRNRGTLIHAPNSDAHEKVGNLTPDEAKDLLLQLACIKEEPSDEIQMLSAKLVEVITLHLPMITW